METNTTRHPRRSDEEWIRLINECRTSGLSDKEWCIQNHIATSKFYYHIRRLTKKACQFPANPRAAGREQHDIVPLKISEEPVVPVAMDEICHNATAVRMSFHDISIEITNYADKSTIINVIGALRLLC